MTTANNESRRGAAAANEAPASTEALPPDPVVAQFLAVVRRLPRYIALGVGLTRDRRVPARAKSAVVLGGVYAVSPIDLVPGLIPVAGQLDDVAVLLLALRRAIRDCPPDLAAEHLSRANLAVTDLDRDLAVCRATARWIAVKGAKLGGRIAVGAGRRVRDVVRSPKRGSRP